MSRVGKAPVLIPGKTKITFKDRVITVQGEKGTLSRSIHPAVNLDVGSDTIKVSVVKDDRTSQAMRGLMRSLISNMVIGVSKGFERILEINGIGYRAVLNGNTLEFNLGYSHPIHFELPDGISASIDKRNVLKLTGIDKELLGQTAASIRELRPPERYKGKGIKYAEERIQRKAGKAGTKAV